LQHTSGAKTLTQKEAEVLKLLCVNRQRVMKREEILTTVWGDDDYFMGRSLDVFISKLRKYLKEDPKVEIVNYHGVGFRLEVGS
jgi:DNA-binding response OmpR family regulator